jgi:hypothetical protein
MTSTRLGDLVPQAPGGDLLAAAAFFVGSFALVPLLPTGFLPPDDLSQTQVYLSRCQPGSTFARDLRGRRSGRAHRRRNPHVQDGLHRHRRRRDRQRPLRPARRGRGAQGDADHQPDAAPGTRRRQKAGRRARLRDALLVLPGARSRSASAARARSTCWCWPARTARCWPSTRARSNASCAAFPASAPSPRSASLVAPGTGGAPDFQRGRPRRQLGGDRRHAAHRHRRRLRPELAKLNLSAAPGADRRQACRRRRARTRTCSSG